MQVIIRIVLRLGACQSHNVDPLEKLVTFENAATLPLYASTSMHYPSLQEARR